MKFCIDIETTGLSPIEDRILSIGVLNIEHETPVIFYGEDESKILTQFWIAIEGADALINFNGDAFDIPFLIKRSLVNNIKISQIKKSIDLRKVCNSFFYSYDKYARGSLRFWGKVLGFDIKTEDGSKMKEFYEKKDWKSIKEHNSEDLQMTKALYERCINCRVLQNEKN